MRQKIVVILLTLALTLSSFTMPTIYAVSANDTVNITIDGQPVAFTNQLPAIVEGRTLVPVRGVFEQLGFQVEWDDLTREVTLTNNSYTVVLTIDSDVFYTNATSNTLDVPAQIINGSTMLPVRAVLESVGCHVDWDNNTNTIVIASSQQSNPAQISAPPQNTSIRTYARLSFNMESSWDNDLSGDGRMFYYPPGDEATGLIQCSFHENTFGSVSEQEAISLLNSGIEGIKGSLTNPAEISRTHYLIGDNYAARTCFYSDIGFNDINDDTQAVTDAVIVLFDDGVALITAIFTPTEYEHTYKDAIEMTLSSISVNMPEPPTTTQTLTPPIATEPAPTPTPTPEPSPTPTPAPAPTTAPTQRQGHYTARYGPRGGAICWCGKYMSQH